MNNTENLKVKNQPFFTIGMTTYNRIDLLKQALRSILNQTYVDFEIIVGNDFIEEPITFETLGFKDSRIIIVNNAENLGERENMNSLLKFASGKYFSWHFDDDLCAPNFLYEMYSVLEKFDFPICAYSSHTFAYGSSSVQSFENKRVIKYSSYSGKEFLRSYLSGGIKALGLGGFYETNYLRSIGGAPWLCDGKIALYSEYLLLVKSGQLHKVAYVNSNLVYCRIHNNSLSAANLNGELFKEAGINLIKESLPLISNEELKEDFQKNLESLLNSIICATINKSNHRTKKQKNLELKEYISLIRLEFNNLESNLLTYANLSIDAVIKNIFWFKLKAFIKQNIPSANLKIVRFGLSYVSKYTNKSF